MSPAKGTNMLKTILMQENIQHQKGTGRRGLPPIIAVCAIFVAVLSLYSQKRQEGRLDKLIQENRALSSEILYMKQQQLAGQEGKK